MLGIVVDAIAGIFPPSLVVFFDPPENAVVLCVDEKSGIQALERTQPMLPLGLGYVEGMTHDYRRHGTTTLFAALDTANGKVLAQCRPRHRHQEYLSFLREIERNVPRNLDVHIIVDNYATHKASASPALVCHATPLPCALYPDLCILAESGGDLVQSHHATGHSPGNLRQREGTCRQNRPLCEELQPPCSPVHLDRHSGFDLRKGGATMQRYLRDSTLGLPYDSGTLLPRLGHTASGLQRLFPRRRTVTWMPCLGRNVTDGSGSTG